jgi:membrane-associated protease RseP (regulator of RpoE activity)
MGFGLGGGFGQFRFGRTLVRFGWVPLGSYVKFPGQDLRPTDRPPAVLPRERTYQQVHPLARVPFVLSAPAVTLALGLALLWAAGETDLLADIRNGWKDIPVPGPLSVGRRAGEAWLRSFAGPGGLVRGAGLTATFFGLVNLLPVPIVSGGAALGQFVECLTSRQFAEKRFMPAMMLLALPLVAVVACWVIGVGQAVFIHG